MRAFFSSPWRPFREDTPLANAAVIFILTTLFYFLGAMMRLVEELSLFWPLLADWFGEQFSTGVLILPGLLAMTRPRGPLHFSLPKTMPIVAVGLGAGVGGYLPGDCFS